MKKSMMMPAVSMMALAGAMPAAAIGAPRMDAAGSTAELLAKVSAKIDKINGELKPRADQALELAQRGQQLSEENKTKVDQFLSQYNQLNDAQQQLTGKLEALETRNLDLEQAFASGGRPGGGAMSAGQEIAEGEALKAWIGGGMSYGLTIKPENAITVVPGGLIAPMRDNEVAGMPMQRLVLRSLLTVTTTQSDVVNYAKQTVRTNNAGITAEGVAAAAASVFTYAPAQTNVAKIVGFAHASDEALADAGQLAGLIDSELRYDVDLNEEAQILAGSGTAGQLNGLTTAATAFAATAGLPNETRIDRLRLGMLQVALSNYAANGITLHPTDWAGIELLKDEDKRYIFGNPNVQATPMLWGLNVVPTLSHAAGEWMTGNFKMAATLYDRQETEILISSEHGENFIEGMKTIKATKRVALAVKKAAALVTGDFTFT